MKNISAQFDSSPQDSSNVNDQLSSGQIREVYCSHSKLIN